jgi:hypothetical protein
MSKEPRALDALLAAGRPMTGASPTTSMLLGLRDVDGPVDPAETLEDNDQVDVADEAVETVETVETEQPPSTGPDHANRDRTVAVATPRRPSRVRTPSGAGTHPGGTLEAATVLLPPDHEVLRSGARREDLPVRDVTYETPAAVYFAFGRLKNDLARHTQRRITVPALLEAAFRCVPDDIESVEAEIGGRGIAAALRTGTQRRLSARVSEDRYRWLQDQTFLLYERSGERVAGSRILTLAICMLLEASGKEPTTFSAGK